MSEIDNIIASYLTDRIEQLEKEMKIKDQQLDSNESFIKQYQMQVEQLEKENAELKDLVLRVFNSSKLDKGLSDEDFDKVMSFLYLKNKKGDFGK